MPAANPRLSITLDPSVAAILRRLSQLTGNSQSALVGQLLTESAPIFERMAAVLEAATRLKEQGDSIPKEMGAGLKRAQERMETQLGLLVDDMDVGLRPILDRAEKVQRRATKGDARSAAAFGGRQEPPMSNRGVTTPPTGKRTGKTRAGKGGRNGSL
jgi:hypothetical protein